MSAVQRQSVDLQGSWRDELTSLCQALEVTGLAMAPEFSITFPQPKRYEIKQSQDKKMTGMEKNIPNLSQVLY